MERMWLPVPDPLGILERLTTEGPVQLKDPLRVALRGRSSPFHGNPTWLPPDVREEFLKSYGEYATKTAEAFAPVGDIEAARRLASTLHERVTAALAR